jgi:hypothetical protein
MIKIALVVLLIITALASSTTRTISQPMSKDIITVQSNCQKWEDLYSSLSSVEKEALARQGCIRAAGPIAIIISRSWVSDCDLAYQISIYLSRRLSGSSTDENVEVTAKNSSEIIKIVRRIWPTVSTSKVLTGDGNIQSEKYNLLSDPALASTAVVPLINEIISKEGMGNDMTFVIFSRLLPELAPAIQIELKRARKFNDTPAQIRCLALLQNMRDPQAVSKLRDLSKKKTLTDFEEKLLRKLIAKAERGERIMFADVEDLEYLNNK